MFSPVVTFVASFLIGLLFLGLLVLWVLNSKIKKEAILHALLAVFVAWTLGTIIKSYFPSPRPYVYQDVRPQTITIPTDNAFPSTHTAVAFALATTIYLHDKRVGVIFFVEASLVAIARVVASVHYPIDVFAGALLGIFIAWVVGRIHIRLK